MDLSILASEGLRNTNIWYPTVLGVLVVASAIFLFVGGTYLLLATNTGARLGFLITIAGLSGMMLLLSTLWWTTNSPFNTLKGRVPRWVPVESIEGDDLARSDIPAIQDITSEDKVPLAEQTNIKAAVDSLVVIPTGTNGEEPEPPDEFQTFTETTDYLVESAYAVGGESWLIKSAPFFKPGNISVTLDSNFPWIHVTGHQPAYAAAVLCPVDKAAQEVPFGDPIPAPTCSPGPGRSPRRARSRRSPRPSRRRRCSAPPPARRRPGPPSNGWPRSSPRRSCSCTDRPTSGTARPGCVHSQPR